MGGGYYFSDRKRMCRALQPFISFTCYVGPTKTKTLIQIRWMGANFIAAAAAAGATLLTRRKWHHP